MGEDDSPKRRRSSGSFWNRDRAIIAIAFVMGLVIGIALTKQFIDPALGSDLQAEYKVLTEKNAALDAQADSYYSCLQTQGINPETCKTE